MSIGYLNPNESRRFFELLAGYKRRIRTWAIGSEHLMIMLVWDRKSAPDRDEP